MVASFLGFAILIVGGCGYNDCCGLVAVWFEVFGVWAMGV